MEHEEAPYEYCVWCNQEIETYYDHENDLWKCSNCNGWVTAHCEPCEGRGYLPENEYERDWINYGNDLITCPDCEGSGFVQASNEFTPEQAAEIIARQKRHGIG